jgi:hypothetical protein
LGDAKEADAEKVPRFREKRFTFSLYSTGRVLLAIGHFRLALLLVFAWIQRAAGAITPVGCDH